MNKKKSCRICIVNLSKEIVKIVILQNNKKSLKTLLNLLLLIMSRQLTRHVHDQHNMYLKQET